MGLDMFLYKVKREEAAYWRKANAIHSWFERNVADGEIENCEDYYVSKEKLIKLRDDCNKVLNSLKVVDGQVKNGERLENGQWVPLYESGKVVENASVAEELMPTERGFFFGSTDYDQYYLEDLRSTVSQIDKILEETDFDNYNIVYNAWW